MPYHPPGEACPRPQPPSAFPSRAASAALLHLGRKRPRVWGVTLHPTCCFEVFFVGDTVSPLSPCCHPAWSLAPAFAGVTAKMERPALAHRIPAPAFDPADREGRAHRRDPRQAGQAIAVDAVVLVQIARRDAQQVVGVAAHQVAIENVAHLHRRRLEPVHRLAALAGQRDLDKGLQLEPQLVRIDLRGIAGDRARRLQRLDPAVTSRGRYPGELGQLGDRARRVLLKRFEQQDVVAVHGMISHQSVSEREISPICRARKANFGETFAGNKRIFGGASQGEP